MALDGEILGRWVSVVDVTRGRSSLREAFELTITQVSTRDIPPLTSRGPFCRIHRVGCFESTLSLRPSYRNGVPRMIQILMGAGPCSARCNGGYMGGAFVYDGHLSTTLRMRINNVNLTRGIRYYCTAV